MSAFAAEENRMTAAEYLKMERQSEHKHQFVDGQVFAMTGASRNHNRVSMNLAGEIHAQMKDSPCEAFLNDMRVKISEFGNYVYPDLVFTCDKPEFEDDVLDTLLNPQVVVEVLSESTEKYDRGKKFAGYRSLPSLHTYILISQDAARVEMFQRQDNGDWLMSVVDGLDGTLKLSQPPLKLKLADLYARVEFSNAESDSDPLSKGSDAASHG